MSERTRPRATGWFCGQPEPVDSVEALEQTMLGLIWLEQKRLAQVLAAHSLTVPQFIVLSSISERQQGCYMGELAGEMLQSSATMTGIVDRLVRMNLVQRQAVLSDRRLVVIDLTEEGRQTLARVRRAQLERLQRILARMAAADQAAFMRLVGLYLTLSNEAYV